MRDAIARGRLASRVDPDVSVEVPETVARRLRVSVTDFCNFRCFFCHNEGQPKHSSARPSLQADDYAVIARACREQGIRYIKLTGGEPLIYRDRSGNTITQIIEAFAGAFNDDDGFDLSITTNGEHLPRMAKQLRSAGLQRATISLATVNRSVHESLIKGRRGDPLDALAAIDAAHQFDLAPVKVNTVLFGPGPSGPGNLDEMPEIIRQCRERGVEELRLYPMLWAPSITEFDQRYVYWDERIMDLVLSAAWATDDEYRLLIDTVRGVLDGVYDETAARSRFTLSFNIGGVRIAMNVMPLDRSQLTCGCQAGAQCQEGPYALRLSASGELRACLSGPVLGSLRNEHGSVTSDHTNLEMSRVKAAFIALHSAQPA